jgi:hypothetical protein
MTDDPMMCITVASEINLDRPMRVEADQFVTTVFGWYAGEADPGNITLREADQVIPCTVEARPDVVAAYPGRKVQGFRSFLDFLTLASAPLVYESAFHLSVSVENAGSKIFTIPVVPGWIDDVRRMRSAASATNTKDLGLGLRSGAEHYRAYVGLPEYYDLSSAGAFQLLTLLGLRQYHRLLDVGCGSLRCGRLLIPFLNSGNYVGVEPNRWLVDQGIRNELGTDIVRVKGPSFLFSETPQVLEKAPCSNFALANSIFSHASLTQIDDWLKHISANLCLSGALVATFLVGPEDYGGDAWIYPGCVRYRVDTIRSLAERHGFHFEMLDWLHLHDQNWAVFAKPNFNLRVATPLTWNARMEAKRS